MPRVARLTSSDARFVFRGTVRRLRASASPLVKGGPDTAVATVEEVIEAPELLSHLAGQEITMRFEGRKRPKKGQQVTFRCVGWLFGEAVAVRVVDFAPFTAAGRALIAATTAPDPAARLAQRDAEARFDQADVVASGRVVSVSLAPGSAPAMLSFNAEANIEDRLSEHVPLWRDAVIEVHAVHKGQHSGDTATVRFPASVDVMWFRAPKFHVGQEGFFMMHRGELAGSKRPDVAVAAGGPSDQTLTALHPADYQPFDQPGGIRQAIGVALPVADETHT